MTTAIKRKAGDVPLADSKKPKANSSITSFFKAPASTTATNDDPSNPTSSSPLTSTAPAVSKFNKDAWVAKLSAEQRELLTLEIETLHESWLAVLKEEVVSKEFLELKRFLKKEKEAGKKIFPPMEDVYSWSRHTPLPTVKAVILGQDPYHNLNQAHGLCFSVRAGIPCPPSLKNIYIGLKNDYPTFRPPPKNGGLLIPWADRGVLLLNTCLTVRAHEPNSHAGHGWEKFTQKVIDTVAKTRTRGVVFLAWGSPAGKRVAKVDRQRHCVLQSVHPSPLSAARGFFDCGHFKKTNEWLAQRYGKDDGPIDWDLDVAPVAAVTATKAEAVPPAEP
ncbi:MAG: uracil DNA glycosylase [Caeruleum heppii]|nr:MAG: uracil DNA glycosylase [Caeruleum heppii]